MITTTNHHEGARALVRRIRRDARAMISRLLSQFFGTQRPVSAPLPAPQRILVCRLNERIGNTLFLTPLLQSLAASFPQARIDVLLKDAAHEKLLRGLPGIGEVKALPLRPMDVVRFVRHIRRQRYDLAIDPAENSQSSRVAVALSGARYKLGFAGDDQWLRLTHAAAIPDDVVHEGLKPLALLGNTVHNLEPDLECFLGVRPGAAAQAKAEQVLAQALSGASTDHRTTLVGFFIEATGSKKLPVDWWQTWLAAMRSTPADIRLLQLLPPGHQTTLADDITGITAADLEVLAALLGKLDCFVAADSGPMHLAAAAGTSVLGVFSHTRAEHYAPLGPGCNSIRAEMGAEQVAARTLELITRGPACKHRNLTRSATSGPTQR